MKNKLTKLFAVTLGLALLTGALSGCGAKDGAKASAAGNSQGGDASSA